MLTQSSGLIEGVIELCLERELELSVALLQAINLLAKPLANCFILGLELLILLRVLLLDLLKSL